MHQCKRAGIAQISGKNAKEFPADPRVKVTRYLLKIVDFNILYKSLDTPWTCFYVRAVGTFKLSHFNIMSFRRISFSSYSKEGVLCNSIRFVP